MERKWERTRGQDGVKGEDEDAGTAVGPLVSDLELLHRSISCTNKAPQSMSAHTLTHIFLIHNAARQNFLFKGKKLGAVGGMYHSVAHLI